MKFSLVKLGAISALLLGCVAVKAEHAAVAYLENDVWGAWATGVSQKEAESSALKSCREAHPKNKCAVQYTAAVAAAGAPDGRFQMSPSTKSKKDAEKTVLDQCGASCKITLSRTAPGFFAILGAKKDGDYVAAHLQYGADTGKWAMEEGVRSCKKKFDLPCDIVSFGAMKGAFDAAPVAQAVKPKAAPASCRPNTPSIRCSSNCTNGNCVVTYENGCKMRVQVQPRFNPFSNQWTYPAPSC